jgi:hypothetical protein
MITETPTPTETLTPTPTATATPNFYIEVVTPAGEAARIERTITAGDWVIIVLLTLILASHWAIHIVEKIGGDS